MLYGILIMMAAFILRSIIAMSLGLFTVFKTEFGRTRRVYKIDIPENQMKKELVQIAKIIPFYSFVVALGHHLGVVQYAEHTIIGTLSTFVVLFVWNEVWFYAFHRAVHHPKLMKIHVDHHRSRVTTPLTVSAFSFIEQTSHILLAVSVPAILSRYIPITLTGVAVYSIPMIIVNVLGHMNVEVYPAWFSSSTLGKYFGTPTYHALHHGRVKGHYGLMTTIPDRLFGSYFEDYALVQARAANGDGLTSLNERLKVKRDDIVHEPIATTPVISSQVA